MFSEHTRRNFFKSAAAASLAYAIGEHHMSAQTAAGQRPEADMILMNGRLATQDERRSFASAVAIKDGRFFAVGTEQEVMRSRGEDTAVIDVGGRTVIPGLNDSHTHPIRGGLNYNMELRWDGVPSLADALRMLREQAQRTPPPQWVRVVGGWTEFQFAERRLPTLDEINAAAPDTPVFVLHLYDRAFLNGAALRAVGYTKETPNPLGGEIQRDGRGNPTGLLLAKSNASILYATLAKGPKLSREDQLNSTRQFMRELNRFGITSVIDAGGGFQNYPEDYEVIQELHRQGQLTVRFAYNLFAQKPKQELEDFTKWSAMVQPGQGDAYYRMNGAGEMLVFSALDFEDFREPRPDLPAALEAELDLTPSLHWPQPTVLIEPPAAHGPVLVAVEYHIDPTQAADFARAMQEVRLERLRDGAMRWELFQDPADPQRYVETFLVESWVEHLRQHERVTLADREAEARARALHIGPTPPTVLHLIAVRAGDHHRTSQP